MALTGTNRGTSEGSNTGATHPFSPISNFTTGAMAVLCLAYDNAGTNGADSFTSISDSLGNTWTTRQSALRDPGASFAGIVLRIFTTNQDAGTITTGTVVTVTLAETEGHPYSAATFTEISSDAGSVSYVNGGTTANNVDGVTITTSSISSGNAVIGCLAREGSSQAPSGDSDTLNGSWSTQQFELETGNISIASQYKVVTADGAQTYNHSGFGFDQCIGWINVSEVVSYTMLDPFGTFGIFGI